MRISYAHKASGVAILGLDGRKALNLSLDGQLVAEAKSLGINLSRVAEDSLRQAVVLAKTEVWKRENAAAISKINQWVEENGIPLGEYRRF
jgi:antitoxin CcdA